MAFSGAFVAPFQPAFDRGGAAVTPWYRAGGAPMPVAAYQPKGAASLAASYVNLANPGTYDAAPGVAPTHDAATGWTFDGTQYLDTGYAPSHPASMIARFSSLSDAGGCVLMGSSTATQWQWFALVPYYGNSERYVAYYSIFTPVLVKMPNGVYAVTADASYLNGAFDRTVGGTTLGTQRTVYIGTINETQTGSVRKSRGNIQATAIWHVTLTAAQVLAVSTAMAAL